MRLSLVRNQAQVFTVMLEYVRGIDLKQLV